MRLVTDNAIAVVTIFQEAEGESFEGKLAVAEVIRNRVARKYNSDGTVVGTCLRAWQFSGWNTDSRNRARSLGVDTVIKAVADCSLAWEQSLNSDTVCGAVLYFNPEIVKPPPKWADPAKLVAKVGNHNFYSA